jgi:formylglycine-generating enzyme required for sulfatase activity
MKNMLRQAFYPACGALLCFILSGVFSCASTSPDLVKQEDGFYYGYGVGSSPAEAADEAKRDLISNALTATLKARNREANRVEISIESAKKVNLDLKPFAEKKEGPAASITYRLKTIEWDKFEEAREAALKDEIRSRLPALTNSRPLAIRMVEALGLLDRLADEGVSELLTLEGPGSELFARKIETICTNETAGIRIVAAPVGGFIRHGTAFSAQALDKTGNGMANLGLKARWSTPDTEPVIVTLKTNSIGNATIEYPAGEAFRNRSVQLLVTTDFAALAAASPVIKDLDQQFAYESKYQHFDDPLAFFDKGVKVTAGKFTAGALAKDKRASKKEAARTVTTGEYYIDTYLVTNALYSMYLHATNAENFPEYWDNSDYNQPDQPVVGVSREDAVRYAAWLSAQLGVVYRLPTEDEWEKAARAGKDVIYPWGDESPEEGDKANYNGNKRFKGPSPVGAFEAGKNAWGLFDMAGNVWQWTATSPTSATQSAAKDGATVTGTAKGGSWMDGPVELRISNRRELIPGKGYADVGFRLVKETSK